MLNKAILMGRLTRDPEMRSTQGGTPVCTFTVAIERRFKTQNGERQADFINCVACRRTAEFVFNHFTKGRMISVVGSIQTRSYTDRDGNNRTAEVVAEEVGFTGEARREDDAGSEYYRPGDFAEIFPADDEDLRFRRDVIWTGNKRL